MSSEQPRNRLWGFSFGEVLVAFGVLGMGLFFLVGALNIPVLAGYARIGPRFFPYIVGAGLLVAGLLLLGQAIGVRAAAAQRTIVRSSQNWRAVTWIAGGLILNVALMERAGYIISTACLFFFAAGGLGSRRYLVNALAGLLLALGTFLAFTRLLDLHLPPGLLEGLIG
jgi:putative tricarboxylic transport membrane protein